jgi:hypothetical protein
VSLLRRLLRPYRHSLEVEPSALIPALQQHSACVASEAASAGLRSIWPPVKEMCASLVVRRRNRSTDSPSRHHCALNFAKRSRRHLPRYAELCPCSAKLDQWYV